MADALPTTSSETPTIGRRQHIRPWRDALVIATLLLATAGLSAFGLCWQSMHAYQVASQGHMQAMAQSAAATVDAELHDALVTADQQDSDAYRQCVQPLRAMRETVDNMAHIYTVRMVDDRVYFVVDAAPPGDHDGDGIDDHAQLMERYKDADPEMLAALRACRTAVTTQPYTDRWGTFMSAYAPIVTDDGRCVGILGIDVKADAYAASMASMQRAAALGMIPAALACLGVGIAVFRIRRRVQASEAERARLVDAVQRSERQQQKLTLVAAHTIHGVIVADTDGNIEWMNEALARALHCNPEDAVGRPCWYFLTEGPSSVGCGAAVSRLKDAVHIGYERSVDVQWTDPEGTSRWLSFEIQPVFELERPDEPAVEAARGGSGGFGGSGNPGRTDRPSANDPDRPGTVPRLRPTHFIAIQRDITAQMSVEADLRSSQERFRLFSMATNDVVWDLNLNTGDIWWNENLRNTFGHDASDMCANLAWWEQQIHHADRERVAQSLIDVVNGAGHHWSAEYRFRRADGAYADVLDRGFVIRNVDRMAIRMVGAIVDLSPQKQAEREVRKLALVAARTDNAVIITDADHRIEWINDGFARLTGFTIEESVGRTPDELLEGKTLGAADADSSTVDFGTAPDGDESEAARQQSYEVERVVKRKGGEPFWAAIERQPVFDQSSPGEAQVDAAGAPSKPHASPRGGSDGSSGRIVNYIYLLRDVTERRRIDQMLRQHKLVVENSDTVLLRWMSGPGWPVDLVSENVRQFGYSASDLLDGRIGLAELIHPEDRSRVAAEADRYRERAAGNALPDDDGRLELEFRIVSADGVERWVFCRAVIDADPSVEAGGNVCFQASMIDIDDRKRAEAALRQSHQFFRSSLDALSAHIAIIDADGYILEVNEQWRQFALANDLNDKAFGVGANYLDVCESASAGRDVRGDACDDGDAGPDDDDAGKARRIAAGIRVVLRGDTDEFLLEYPCHSPTQQRWYIARVTRFHGSDEPMAVIAHEDITSRKLSEIALADNEERLRQQSTAVMDLANAPAVRSGDWDSAILAVTEAAARTMDVDRASVWVFEEGNARLICADLFDGAANQHTAGSMIQCEDCPRYIRAVHSQSVLSVTDAATDPQTSEFAATYLVPNGIQSMLDAPIWLGGRLIGVLCIESVGRSRSWLLEEQNFATSLASILSLVTETAERNRVERELMIARDAAEAANRAKSHILANMSHEIRTPMTAILGYSEMLLDPTLPDDVRRTYIETIHRNGDHLLTVINDVLDISKIEAGQMTVERVACNPRTLISDVASLLRIRAADKDLDFNVTFDGRVPASMHTDPTRLRQILMNLIGNAIKFTERGSVGVRASVERAEHSSIREGGSSTLCIDVVDTGIGIDEQTISRLFKPFHQADITTTRRFGGTGLGLAISKRLAVLLGGELTVTSTPGQGSCFTVRVDTGVPFEKLTEVASGDASSEGARHAGADRVSGSSAKAMRSGAQSPQHTSGRPLDGSHILLAEDGPDNQRLVQFILEKAGATVTLAVNGKEAVECMRSQSTDRDQRPVDLILMDMQMPVMDGYDATRSLRESGIQTPIIALTAHAMPGDREKCLQAGCDDYAVKPINRVDLLSLIMSLVPARNDSVAAGDADVTSRRGETTS